MQLGSVSSKISCVFACAAMCWKERGRFLKDRGREWDRESRLILIASLTVSVGFSTLRSTRYKGKSGGEVRKRHSILIYCPTTVLLTTLSTMLLSVGHFRPWINTHTFPGPGVPQVSELAVQCERQHFGNFTLQLFYELANHFIRWIWLWCCTLHVLMSWAQDSPK